MRILLVEASGRGFLSHYAHALALGFFHAGHEVRLVTGHRDELTGWQLPFAKRACLPKGWGSWLCLAGEVADFQPNVVHLQWVDKPVAAQLFSVWAHQRGIRVVYTPHNILPHRRRWFTMPAFRALYGRVDRIVARDQHIAWGLEEILGVAPTRVALLPGSPNLMAHPDAPRAALAELPEKRSGEFRLLYFGHGSARKGLALLLVTLLSSTWPDTFHLVVAGEGVLTGVKPEWLAQAQCHVRITVINRYVAPAGVAALFTHADLMVMPYMKLCKSPLTDLAAAFCLPVLRSDRVEAAYFREGLHGMTIPHGNSHALSETLSRLVEQPTQLAPLRKALAREETVVTAIERLSAGHQRLYEDLQDAPMPDSGLDAITEKRLMTQVSNGGS